MFALFQYLDFGATSRPVVAVAAMNNSTYKQYVDNSATPNRDLLTTMALPFDTTDFTINYDDSQMQTLIEEVNQINEEYEKNGINNTAVPDVALFEQEVHKMSKYGQGKKIKMLKKPVSSESEDSEESVSDFEENKPVVNELNKKQLSTSSFSASRKRKLLPTKKQIDENNDSDSENDEDVVGVDKKIILHVKKARGRYKRAVKPTMDMQKASEMVTTETNTAMFAMLNKHVVKTQSDVENLDKMIVDERDRKFVSVMTSTAYYMFVVCKAKNPVDKFRLFYANCVSSVTVEYAGRYSGVDRLVMVVSFNKFRFMISYQLLKDMNIPIPASEDFSSAVDTQKAKRECHFNEVKDFEFLNLLTNTFNLDMTYVRVKTTLFFASLGEYKSNLILDTLNSMNQDKSLYSLPFNMQCKELVVNENVISGSVNGGGGGDVYPYVNNIIKMSKGMVYKQLDLKRVEDNKHAMAMVVNNLKFWLRDNRTKSSEFKDKSCLFAYKFASVVRLLYDEKDSRIFNLVKIKKDNNASASVIESYLNMSGVDEKSENFILISTKTDERITIIKCGTEYVWITSVIKNIIPVDIIDTFKKHNHHIFNLNKLNRKEINSRHNGMIKLLAYYTGKFLSMDQIKYVAQNDFSCTYINKNYN
ncbi:IE-1 [Orgyia pseudotsugata single capsid nuclopolyhedrovirus]|nr:IE-1 [Orgyia pseudotsugata single capsid nuclopolyhedrovirus]